MKKIFALMVLIISFALPTLGQTNSASRHVDAHVKPFADLFFFVVSLPPGSEKMPKIDGFAQAVEAARPIQDTFRLGIGPLLQTLGAVSAAALPCERAAEAVPAFAQLPETVSLPNGETLRLRETAVKLAQALAVIEEPFLQKVWPQHKAALDQAAAKLAKTFSPKESACFAYLAKSLGLETPRERVPLYLVVEAPRPGGFTFRLRNQQAVCIISTEANQDSQLFEVVLHESTHALDLETSGQKNVLAELRARLLKAGLSESDPDFRNVPHTLMFIQAAETIRRIVDPVHKHYGETKGYYARVPLASKVELPIWLAHLDGKISREEAINQIITEFLKARKEAGVPK